MNDSKTLGDMQPCGHPVQAIRSGRDKGNHTSNWCGWCADVDKLKWMLSDCPYCARLREALEAQALRDDIKSEWYRQSDLGKPPSEERWASIGYEHVAGARKHAIALRQAALSTPADEQGAEHWLSCHDEEVGREAIEQFVERVNRAAEFAMEKTGKLEGAHYAGMQLELAAIREGQDEISGVVGNRNENVADA